MTDPTAELVALTSDLVEIPSHEDETAAGDYIEDWLRTETDASVERDAAGNVLATRGEGEESLALVGHHDVVPPADSQLRDDGRYLVEERDGRLFGRGTADMKGAVAAAMLAFRDAAPESELQFVSFVGEETGGEGARAYLDRTTPEERFDYAVVGEGSTNYSGAGVTDVVVAHKGRRGSTLTATVLGEELTGSVAVTEIEGGEAANVIPDSCTVTVDERTVPGERAALERVEEIEGVEWTVGDDLPPMACSDEAFADAALAAAREAVEGGEPQHVTKPHATDAGWLAAEGVATVVAGPAESGEAHTDTESVAIDVLARCYRLYRSVAEW